MGGAGLGTLFGMSAYTVLANKYRPRRFADVVGQEDLARVLERAVAQGRAAHAYLFCGPRGVGKTSMARIMAKAFNCLENDSGQPCGTCRVCAAIDEQGTVLDVVEIDGASHNRVENVRELIENLRFRPVEARNRIYIVDEVHMLSTAAFNALLKTLEEPPEHAKFILATTEPLKVPETIRSRCQQFDFRRLSADQIAKHLAFICSEENASVPDGLLPRVARHARGGMRDALSLLDQLLTFGDGSPTIEDFERLTGRLGPDLLHGIIAAALAGDVGPVMAGVDRAFDQGARAADVVAQITEVLEGLLVAAVGGIPTDRTDDERVQLASLAERTNVDHVMAMLDVMMEATSRLKQRHDGRLVVEMAMLTAARLPALQSLDAFLAGAPAPAAAPAGSAPRAPAQPARPQVSAAPARSASPPAPTRPSAPPASPPPGPSASASARAPAGTRPSAPTATPRSAGPEASAAAAVATEPARAPAPPRAPAPTPAPSAPPPPSTARNAPPSSPRQGPGPADPVPAPEEGKPPEAFSDRFIAAVARGARSVSVELKRYSIRVEDDRLILEPPSAGASPMIDPTEAANKKRLESIASEMVGHPVRLEVAAVRPAASAPAGDDDGVSDREGVDERVRRQFPGAERLEP